MRNQILFISKDGKAAWGRNVDVDCPVWEVETVAPAVEVHSGDSELTVVNDRRYFHRRVVALAGCRQRPVVYSELDAQQTCEWLAERPWTAVAVWGLDAQSPSGLGLMDVHCDPLLH